MLPHHDRVPLQVLHVREVPLATGVIAQNPADVREPETASGGIGIVIIIIHILMMAAMIRCPVQHIVLQGAGPAKGKDQAQYRMRLVGLVRPHAVIARSDGQPTEGHHENEEQPLEQVVTVEEAIEGNQG